MKIFIVGLMGSGKSHTGKKLAKKLGFEFVDMDQSIENQTGKSISAIFKEHGEAHFRQLEKDQLSSLTERKNLIVSTGGGTACYFDNMKLMNENGITVYLRTPAWLLVNRLLNELDNRPLISEMTSKELKEFLEKQLVERNPFYEQAQLIYFQEAEDQKIEDELIDRLNLLNYSVSNE